MFSTLTSTFTGAPRVRWQQGTRSRENQISKMLRLELSRKHWPYITRRVQSTPLAHTVSPMYFRARFSIAKNSIGQAPMTLIIALGLLGCLSGGLTASTVPQDSGQGGYWHGEREGVVFHPSGEMIAFAESAETVHPDLTAHSRKMFPGVYQVADRVFLAYGYALTSPAMIVGDDGVIIVDPPEDVAKGEQCLAEF